MDAIIEYNNTLITIPKTLNDDPNHVNRKLIITAFNCLQARCTIYLSANPNEELSENMRKLRERQFEFLAGGVYKSELALYSSVMLFMNLKQNVSYLKGGFSAIWSALKTPYFECLTDINDQYIVITPPPYLQFGVMSVNSAPLAFPFSSGWVAILIEKAGDVQDVDSIVCHFSFS